jgi:hypothetical protein
LGLEVGLEVETGGRVMGRIGRERRQDRGFSQR